MAAAMNIQQITLRHRDKHASGNATLNGLITQTVWRVL